MNKSEFKAFLSAVPKAELHLHLEAVISLSGIKKLYKNKFGKECYKLHFTQFYDDEVVAGFVQDEEDDNVFIYTSKEMNVEYDTIIADSIEDAKEQIEEMLVEHWNDEINYLENRISSFQENDD